MIDKWPRGGSEMFQLPAEGFPPEGKVPSAGSESHDRTLEIQPDATLSVW